MTRIAPLLLLIAVGTAAEGEPATPPTPAAEPATTEPAPAPAAEAAEPVAQPAAAAPAARRRSGVRVARVAAPQPVWDARLRLGAGWDSNALLDSDPDEARSSTADYSGEAAIGWRPVADERDYVKATASVLYNRRPHLDDLDTSRLALGVSGARQGQTLTTGASISAARYWLDGDGAAGELRGGVSIGWLRSGSADLLAIELAAIHFDEDADRPEGAEGLFQFGDADDRSGVLASLSYRHWWQLGSNARIEAGFRAGEYIANADSETYLLAQPWVAARLRHEAWEFQGRAGLEWRAYDAAAVAGDDSEDATIASISASADRRVAAGLWLGAFAGLGSRDSSVDGRDYDRWQAGARLTYTIASED